MSTPAPGDLELVRKFVNTYDAEDGTDSLDTPTALTRWFAERDLLTPKSARASADDLDCAIAVREALRAILRANHDDTPAPPVAAARTLDDAAARAGLRVHFNPGGGARQRPDAAGADGGIGWLLSFVGDAMRDGTWERMKICPADDCAIAFYDHSRNRCAVWCDPRECGNRAKVRAHRRRAAAAKS